MLPRVGIPIGLTALGVYVGTKYADISAKAAQCSTLCLPRNWELYNNGQKLELQYPDPTKGPDGKDNPVCPRPSCGEKKDGDTCNKITNKSNCESYCISQCKTKYNINDMTNYDPTHVTSIMKKFADLISSVLQFFTDNAMVIGIIILVVLFIGFVL